MSQWLRAFVLPQRPGFSSQCPHGGSHLQLQFLGIQNPILGSTGTRHTYIHICKTPIHINTSLKDILCFNYVYIYACLCLCVCSADRGQKRVPDPLDLQLPAVLHCPVWVLGTEFGSAK